MAARKYVGKLEGSLILIFGGTSGIGLGVAEASIEHGATVILSGSNQYKIDQTVSKLSAAYPHVPSTQVRGHVCDLSDANKLESELSALLRAATNNGSNKLDHIVFTAGDALSPIPLSEITQDSIKNAGTIRFIAPLILAKFIPAYMKSSPDSSFTITSGVIGTKPLPGWTLVAAYGMAQEGLSRGLAVELAPVRVNCVSPGPVKTALLGGIPDEVLEYMRQATVTKRLGRVEDVSEAYLYAMKDGFVTGDCTSFKWRRTVDLIARPFLPPVSTVPV